MKKIINGKKYDTETATVVAEWSTPDSWNSHTHTEETLYRKKTGEFFIYGEGGPQTKYATDMGQGAWMMGDKIIPLSFEAARKWAEEHLEVEEYESIFGEVEEDESKSVCSYRLLVSTQEKLRRKAAEAGVGVSELLESILANNL